MSLIAFRCSKPNSEKQPTEIKKDSSWIWSHGVGGGVEVFSCIVIRRSWFQWLRKPANFPGRVGGIRGWSKAVAIYNERFRSLFRFTSGKKWKNFTHFPPFEPFWKALVETSHISTSREYIDSLRVKLIEFLALHNISVYIIQVLLDKDIFRVALKLWYCGMLNVATWCSTTHEWMSCDDTER